MFSYIYADNTYKGINYFVVHKTEEGIKKLALNHINDLAYDLRNIDKNHTSYQVYQNLLKSINQKDIDKSMGLLKILYSDTFNYEIIIHAIEPITIH